MCSAIVLRPNSILLDVQISFGLWRTHPFRSSPNNVTFNPIRLCQTTLHHINFLHIRSFRECRWSCVKYFNLYVCINLVDHVHSIPQPSILPFISFHPRISPGMWMISVRTHYCPQRSKWPLLKFFPLPHILILATESREEGSIAGSVGQEKPTVHTHTYLGRKQLNRPVLQWNPKYYYTLINLRWSKWSLTLVYGL